MNEGGCRIGYGASPVPLRPPSESSRLVYTLLLRKLRSGTPKFQQINSNIDATSTSATTGSRRKSLRHRVDCEQSAV